MRFFRRLLIAAFWIFPLVHYGQSQPSYPRQYVTVEGKRMSYTSFGLSARRQGEPVVLFEAGYGASGSLFFKNLFPALSKFTTGIGYDRNGEGGSEEDTTILTDADLMHRLHAFLTVAKVPPPYILVGHSLGGPYIRMFTSLYPGEVAGLVFIDAPNFMLTDQQEEEIRRSFGESSGVKTSFNRSLDNTANDTLWGPLMRHRAKRLSALFRNGSFREYDSVTPLPDIPVAVLLAYNKQMDTSRHYTLVDQARFRKLDDFRVQDFAAMIANNHNSGLILLPGYGHFITSQDPDLVISAIRRIYQRALRTKSLK